MKFCIITQPLSDPKANPEPLIYVKKSGKDDLKVESFTMQFDVIDTVPKRIKFVCPGFAVSTAGREIILWVLVNVTQFIGAYFVTLTRMSH